MNEVPTIHERLAKVPNGALSVRLSIARTRLAHGDTPFKRARAIEEIEMIKRVMFERGLATAE